MLKYRVSVPKQALLALGYTFAPGALEEAIKRCGGKVPIVDRFDWCNPGAIVGVTDGMTVDGEDVIVDFSVRQPLAPTNVSVSFGAAIRLRHVYSDGDAKIVDDAELLALTPEAANPAAPIDSDKG